ncbi:VOC family protein [Paenibacillus sp. P96]|uniref:VOC family protein n=1 Tax=Paenibacillus zeirhizosphaerae TaxID=2987519 RepID=A0ABT9FT77_9BACL|nr:VOC family protein [Paenibacillus sp. P96]MDP4097928.1 VOC family protein [Paenibacillus sp. P96]
MHIEHVAMWVLDLEKMKEFYVKYFGGSANHKYRNDRTLLESYFITFDSGCRLELMQKPSVNEAHRNTPDHQTLGYIHAAFSVGAKEKVDALTHRLRKDGYQVIGDPRTTGDGYYESVVLDPENNRIEITA